MPTPTNRLVGERVAFNKDHLRYAFNVMQAAKEHGAKFAKREIPTAEQAPALWFVEMKRCSFKVANKNRTIHALRKLKLNWRVGSTTVVINCPSNNELLKGIAGIIELRPLRFMEKSNLPDSPVFSLLNSRAEFVTYPLPKHLGLLEAEEEYEKKLAKEGITFKPVPRGGWHSHLETTV